MALPVHLIAHTCLMPQDRNAGIKRNRRPTGTKAVRTVAFISDETYHELEKARMESGGLSIGLYLELLTAALKQEHGSLPVLSPTLNDSEQHVTAA